MVLKARKCTISYIFQLVTEDVSRGRMGKYCNLPDFIYLKTKNTDHFDQCFINL